MKSQIDHTAGALVGWLLGMALPLWSTAGFDVEHDRFEERLTLEGRRLPAVDIRLMSQARQIYVYALAARRGWRDGGRDLVERAYASMVRDYHRRDGADGWIFSIERDGGVANGRRDFYAHAFVLLAIASYVQMGGKRDALMLADETLAFLDRQLKAPAGGYLEGLLTVDETRRQNPHMHLFESLIALWECSDEPRFLDRAGELYELFKTRFFLRPQGVLGEYFTAALAPAPGVQGQIVEPGHHYEWVWLLRRFQRARGADVDAFADSLYRHADLHGHDREGLVVDELLANGEPRTRSRRTWPVTEAIKANVAEAEVGRPGAAAKALLLTGLLHRHFLNDRYGGGWMDRLDEAGRPATDFMPASTFYHVICAIDELQRLARPG
jgi:mannose/cellobiose epimerase-like protein (N-acyl-D-glucosamine 2-epimerase family)